MCQLKESTFLDFVATRNNIAGTLLALNADVYR